MDSEVFQGYKLRELTFSRVLADKASRNGDKVYLRYMPDGRSYSYRELDQITNRIVNGLLGLGIGRGTRVAILMDNSPEHVLLHYALGKVGALAASINPGARGTLLRHFIDLSDAAAVFADSALVERFVEVRADVPLVRRLIVHGQAACEGDASLQVSRFEELADSPDTPLDPGVTPYDPAKILFTSGTTGPSKGALYTQAKSLIYCLEFNAAFGIRSDDTIYCWNPMFHLASFHSALLTALLADASAVLTRTFSVSKFWDEVRTSRATVFSLMGSTVNMLWNQPERDDDRRHDARLCLAVPVPEFSAGFTRRFGVEFASSYGLSDFGLFSVYLTSRDPVAKRGSCGQPVNDWQVRIVDEHDFELPPGKAGEIVARCDRPWAMPLGYYKNPQATVDAWRNGWFHTGDKGYIDEDGYIWYVGRIKDSIRRRGENISAFEVEHAIASHPAVAEAAAFAVKSEMVEDEVAVAILLKDDLLLSEADLIEHCGRNLAYFMVPRYVRFVRELPRNPNHKIEKYKLQEEANENLGLYWDREKAGIILRR